jgi:hypothetical protein
VRRRTGGEGVELVAEEREVLRDAVVHLAGEPAALLGRGGDAQLVEQRGRLQRQGVPLDGLDQGRDQNSEEQPSAADHSSTTTPTRLSRT